MTNLTKLLSAAALTLTLTACATRYGDKPMDESMTKSESSMMEDKGMKDDMKADSPMVGGAVMYPTKTIVENASAADNLTTLVAAVVQAELVETLSGPGPFTVFAPTNDAFSRLPAATVSALMMDENREDLQKVLTAHVVPGTISAADLIGKIQGTTGTFTAQTVSGDTLSFYVINGDVKIADENGTLATVTTADVYQSNGVVHVINSVLVPK